MPVRDTLERWIVGTPPISEQTENDPHPLMRRTATELARVGDAAEALHALLQAQERERTEVLRVLETLHEPLMALPRMAGQQDRLGDTIAEALLHTRQRDATIDNTLSRIVDGISQQTEVSGLIQQQLDLNLQAANGVADGTARLTDAVTELTTAQRHGTEFLAELVRQSREVAEARAKDEHSLRGWMIALLSMSACLMVAALILGWIALSRPA